VRKGVFSKKALAFCSKALELNGRKLILVYNNCNPAQYPRCFVGKYASRNTDHDQFLWKNLQGQKSGCCTVCWPMSIKEFTKLGETS